MPRVRSHPPSLPHGDGTRAGRAHQQPGQRIAGDGRSPGRQTTATRRATTHADGGKRTPGRRTRIPGRPRKAHTRCRGGMAGLRRPGHVVCRVFAGRQPRRAAHHHRHAHRQHAEGGHRGTHRTGNVRFPPATHQPPERGNSRHRRTNGQRPRLSGRTAHAGPRGGRGLGGIAEDDKALRPFLLGALHRSRRNGDGFGLVHRMEKQPRRLPPARHGAV